MYQALYRKWRPRVFEDVVGQDAVTTVLRRQVMEGKVSHAYLFTGSRGTGKTTCSKILAKAVNCENPQDGDPCLKCDSCKAIESASAVDVLEIDAASNNSVDNIRDLKEEAAFTPVALKYRVYIIDEVHMLSIGAFNALLKLMEEPPSHVIFILATTEVHKVPATILSRCQRFDFGRIDVAHIEGRLDQIAQAEGVHLTQDASALIAKLADGGLRDALTLFDQCVSRCEDVDTDTVTQVAGIAGVDGVFKLAEALCGKDVPAALAALQALYEQSVDLRRLCADLTGCFRNLMVIKTTPDPDRLIPAPPDELLRLKALAGNVGLPMLLDTLTKLQELADHLSKAAAKRTEFEMTIVRICTFEPEAQHSGEQGQSYDALVRRIDLLEQKLESAALSGVGGRGAATYQEGGAGPTQRQGGFSQDFPQAPPAVPEDGYRQEGLPVEADKPDFTEQPDIDENLLQQFPLWEQALQKLSTINPPLCGTLNGSTAFVRDDTLLIKCENALFRRLIREDENAKSSLRRALFAVSG